MSYINDQRLHNPTSKLFKDIGCVLNKAVGSNEKLKQFEVRNLMLLVLMTFLSMLNGNAQYSAGSGAGTTGTDFTFVGVQAGQINTGSENTFVGTDAGGANTTGNANTFLGRSAGASNISGTFNTFLGYEAGLENTTGNNNSFFGVNAGKNNTTGWFNTFIGNRAGRENTTGDYNTVLGHDAGFSNTSGSDNIFLGASAGYFNVTGFENAFVGNESGQANVSGERNTFVGNHSGQANTSGDRNTFIGEASGGLHKTGDANTFIGRNAGHENESGGFNICIGNDAGRFNNGSNNVIIGQAAGPAQGSTEGNNNLYIDWVRTDDPLIYGEFDNDLIRINGEFEVMGAVSNSSDVNRKEAIIPVNTETILNKIKSMPIHEWQYKGEAIRHLGPMAQDFHAAFSLGESDKMINTIDSEGVALAAIQALAKQNEAQNILIAKLLQEVQELKRSQN